MDGPVPDAPLSFLSRERCEDFVAALRRTGYQCVGPRTSDGAIIYGPIERWSQLPHGYGTTQAPGHYQIHNDGHQRAFAWANGPSALKPLLFSPRELLWRTERDAHGTLVFRQSSPDAPALAVIGVRACDVAALRVQDRVFAGSAIQDPYYAARRAKLFLIGVNCSHPAATCFCSSTGDGPAIDNGCDIVLTELDNGYLVQPHTDAGRNVIAGLALPLATDEQHFDAGRQTAAAIHIQTRALPPVALRRQLMDRLDHPRWSDVAERCLSCGNCTAVCPTCFCHSQHSEPAIDGSHSDHVREWDSCFTQKHSYIHGTTIRADTRARYRQWLTHKLATWHDQFDTSGCVGCGRCIAWCPAGIDMTEEVQAIVGEDPA